eukprot:TRINITY_DN6696_c0_g1_i2.p1 TRINITY_DN6696_c0_g1~~TRINITY_DN6696_c0_g1_i2.p1  ORF type:complete len:209 (+),score=24.47 TRINITY_DN6696_c0_g1_i2:141-767(+)
MKEDKLLVHYNGRGSAWDEWIELSSPRISLFRSRTIQSPNSIFNCCYPHLSPDKELAPTEFNGSLNSFLNSSEALHKLMRTFAEETKSPSKPMAAQIAPLLDRIGRVMVDLGKHFSSIACEGQCAGEDVVRLPRMPLGGESSGGLQVGIMPSPSELGVLRESQRENSSVIHVQQIILSRNESGAATLPLHAETGNIPNSLLERNGENQ